MGKTRYILTKDISQIQHFLFYIKEMSEQGLNFYGYNFPVYSYKNKTLIECRLLFNSQNKDVLCNLWDICNNCVYCGLTTEYGNYGSINKKILANMKRVFQKLGVKIND